jgi:SAM-dependent methyltransferase
VNLLARAHLRVACYLAASNFRRKFGVRLNGTIAAEDDLLHASLVQVSRRRSRFRHYRAAWVYYRRGRRIVGEIQKLLLQLGSPLGEADSVLEFACGYGRLTRHFVERIPPSKLVVSDIDRAAVDFVRESFGVGGFYSSREPEKLLDDRRYDLIIVVSLFSHLPAERWTGWLRRLEEMLKPQGLLVFSTLPMGASVGDDHKEVFELGYFYSENNETRGRLGGDQYGTVFVTKDFVTNVVSESLTAEWVNHSPRALNGVQDICVVRARAGRPVAARAAALVG